MMLASYDNLERLCKLFQRYHPEIEKITLKKCEPQTTVVDIIANVDEKDSIWLKYALLNMLTTIDESIKREVVVNVKQ